jgi:hypothetical protein
MYIWAEQLRPKPAEEDGDSKVGTRGFPVIVFHNLYAETAFREKIKQYLTEKTEIMRLFPQKVPLGHHDIGWGVPLADIRNIREKNLKLKILYDFR